METKLERLWRNIKYGALWITMIPILILIGLYQVITGNHFDDMHDSEYYVYDD